MLVGFGNLVGNIWFVFVFCGGGKFIFVLFFILFLIIWFVILFFILFFVDFVVIWFCMVDCIFWFVFLDVVFKVVILVFSFWGDGSCLFKVSWFEGIGILVMGFVLFVFCLFIV